MAGDPGSIPGSGRSPGEGNGHPLQYSCLENPMDRGAWQVTRVRHDIATKPPTTTGCTVYEKTLMLGKIEGRRRRE